jgi:hypothetical protein
VLAVAGCGGDDAASRTERTNAPLGLTELIDLISGFSGDSGASGSPKELARRSGFVVEGTLVSIAPGRGLGTGADLIPTAVMAIRPDGALSGQPPRSTDGLVYVESFVRTPLREVHAVSSVQVLVYAKDVSEWPKEGVLQPADPEAGRPSGAPLAFVVHPDGLVLQSEDGRVARPLRSAHAAPGDLHHYQPDRASWPNDPGTTTTTPQPADDQPVGPTATAPAA